MKRTLAVLAVAGLVIGGGAAAYAVTIGGDRGARTQAKACVDKARTDHASAAKASDAKARHAAVADCLKAAGITPLGVGHVPKAVRDAVKALPADKKAALADCVRKARDDNAGNRKNFRDAARTCLSQTGITIPAPTPEDLARRQKARGCLAQAREDHPDATRKDLRAAVKACVGAK